MFCRKYDCCLKYKAAAVGGTLWLKKKKQKMLMQRLGFATFYCKKIQIKDYFLFSQ